MATALFGAAQPLPAAGAPAGNSTPSDANLDAGGPSRAALRRKKRARKKELELKNKRPPDDPPAALQPDGSALATPSALAEAAAAAAADSAGKCDENVDARMVAAGSTDLVAEAFIAAVAQRLFDDDDTADDMLHQGDEKFVRRLASAGKACSAGFVRGRVAAGAPKAAAVVEMKLILTDMARTIGAERRAGEGGAGKVCAGEGRPSYG